jgi:penicillin amidase
LTWGKKNEYYKQNVFFQGMLPKFLGFDSGPYQMRGGRETVVQALVVRAGEEKQKAVCGQVWRFITDLGTQSSFTTLPGGPNGRRFSGLYTNEVKDWAEYKYKKIDLH